MRSARWSVLGEPATTGEAMCHSAPSRRFERPQSSATPESRCASPMAARTARAHRGGGAAALFALRENVCIHCCRTSSSWYWLSCVDSAHGFSWLMKSASKNRSGSARRRGASSRLRGAAHWALILTRRGRASSGPRSTRRGLTRIVVDALQPAAQAGSTSA